MVNKRSLICYWQWIRLSEITAGNKIETTSVLGINSPICKNVKKRLIEMNRKTARNLNHGQEHGLGDPTLSALLLTRDNRCPTPLAGRILSLTMSFEGDDLFFVWTQRKNGCRIVKPWWKHCKNYNLKFELWRKNVEFWKSTSPVLQETWSWSEVCCQRRCTM